jgi:ketol-acid reductoisomerase
MKILDLYRDNQFPNKDDFANATIEELFELKEIAQRDFVKIEDQLRKAKANTANNEELINTNWYRKATSAKRIKGLLIQRIQNQFSQRNRTKKEQNRESMRINREKNIQYHLETDGSKLRSLIATMKKVLSPDLFESVLTQWKATRPERENNHNQEEKRNGQD